MLIPESESILESVCFFAGLGIKKTIYCVGIEIKKMELFLNRNPAFKSWNRNQSFQGSGTGIGMESVDFLLESDSEPKSRLLNFPGIGTGIRIKKCPESCITDSHTL